MHEQFLTLSYFVAVILVTLLSFAWICLHCRPGIDRQRQRLRFAGHLPYLIQKPVPVPYDFVELKVFRVFLSLMIKESYIMDE